MPGKDFRSGHFMSLNSLWNAGPQDIVEVSIPSQLFFGGGS